MLLRTHILLFFLINSLLVFAHREDVYYLTGYIGNDSVYMRIDEFGDICYGRLSKISDYDETIFSGEISYRNFTLHSYLWDSVEKTKTPDITLSLAELPDTSWKGTWIKDSDTLQVHLHRIIIKNIPHNFKKIMFEFNVDPYMYMRSANLNFVKTHTEHYNKKYSLQWYKEPESGIEFFRLKKGFSPELADTFNTTLTYIHLMESLNKLSCHTLLHSGSYIYKASIEFLSSNIICYKTNTQSDCVGDFMETTELYHTVSMLTGRDLEFDEIFWMGDDTLPRIGSHEWYQFRYNVFGDKMVSLFKEMYPDKMTKSSEGCNFSDKKLWQFPKWHLTREGVYIEPQAPAIRQKCKPVNWTILPYSKIQTYLHQPYRID